MLHLYTRSFPLTKPCTFPSATLHPSWSLSLLSLDHPILHPEKHSMQLSKLWFRTAGLIFLKRHSLVAQVVKNLPAMQVIPSWPGDQTPKSPAESYASLPSIKNPHVTFHMRSKFLGLTPKSSASQSPATFLLQVCKDWGHTQSFPLRAMLFLNPESLSHTHTPLH